MFVIYYSEVNKTKEQPVFFLKDSNFYLWWWDGYIILVFWEPLYKTKFILDAEKHGVISLPQWH